MIRVLYRKQDFHLLFGSVGQNECLEGEHIMLISVFKHSSYLPLLKSALGRGKVLQSN